MIYRKGIISTLAIVVLLIVSGCGGPDSKKSEKAKAFDPVGDWEYKVTTDVSYGVITIAGNKGAYTASMSTEVFGTLEVKGLKIEGTTLTGNLDVGGTAAKLNCEFDGDEITGAVIAGEDKFPFVGKRVEK